MQLSSKAKKVIGFAGNAIVIIAMIAFLDGQLRIWGFVGYAIFISGMALYRLMKSNFFMLGLRNIESVIWNKPLDKDLWNKGEMKNTKVEMYFKGEKMNWKKILAIPRPKMFTNEHAAATFMAFFMVFFVIFVMNNYTMNLVFAIMMLQFSLYFKTAALIRKTNDDVVEIKECLKR